MDPIDQPGPSTSIDSGPSPSPLADPSQSSESGTPSCLVCGKIYGGQRNCGVNACRGCSQFYTRSIIDNTIYKCLTGEKKCELDTVRITCKYCRFKKCVEVGMVYRSKRRTSNASANVPERVEKREEEHLQLFQGFDRLTPGALLYIRTLLRCYGVSCFERQLHENGLRTSTDPTTIQVKNRSICYLYRSKLLKIYDYNLRDQDKAFRTLFEDYFKFPAPLQNHARNVLMFKMWDVESAFRTLRYFDDVNSTRLMWTELMYVDMNDASLHLEAEDPIDPSDRMQITGYIRNMVENCLTTTHSFFHRISLTDVEFLALILLLTWDPKLMLGDEFSQELAYFHRRIIYGELYYYYRYVMRLNNHVERVMNLTAALAIIDNNVYRIAEDFAFLKSFNYFGTELRLFEGASHVPTKDPRRA